MALVDNLIYMITPSASSVATDSILPLSTIARRTGRILKNNSDSIILGVPGYYAVSVNVTFTAPATGDVTINVQKSSTNIPGLTASCTIGTATTEIHTLTITGIIRTMPFEGAAVLSVVNSGVAIDPSNISVAVEYLG